MATNSTTTKPIKAATPPPIQSSVLLLDAGAAAAAGAGLAVGVAGLPFTRLFTLVAVVPRLLIVFVSELKKFESTVLLRSMARLVLSQARG